MQFISIILSAIIIISVVSSCSSVTERKVASEEIQEKKEKIDRRFISSKW